VPHGRRPQSTASAGRGGSRGASPAEGDIGFEWRRFTADRGDARKRADLAVVRHLADRPDVSRTRVRRWVEAGRVLVNGEPVGRPAVRLAQDDVVEVGLPPLVRRPRPAPEPLPLDVVYQDEVLLVVNKPPGVVVHPAHGHRGGTLFNALLWHARSWPDGQRPSLVHRLDRHTSGLLLVARTRVVHARLARLLGSREAEKDYLAVVHGRARRSRFDVTLRLGPDPADRRRVVASATEGRPSVTRVERLAASSGPRRGLSLVRCRLLTGRMHQIRAHLAAVGLPLVGDPVYRRTEEVAWPEDPALSEVCQRFARQALHAWRLTFPHPVSGRRLEFEAGLPDDMAELVAAAGFTTPALRLTGSSRPR
jgi:23S rRNA pseudouridine1911/1915/1917 synthase